MLLPKEIEESSAFAIQILTLSNNNLRASQLLMRIVKLQSHPIAKNVSGVGSVCS